MIQGYRGMKPDITSSLRDAITAHEAVRQGVATHVEKHRLAREETHRKLRARNAIASPVRPGHGALRAYRPVL